MWRLIALLRGPALPLLPRGPAWRWMWLSPMLLLAAFVLVAALVGAIDADPATLIVHALRILSIAAAATLVCLALSVPAALMRPGAAWLLPVWFGFGPGLAAWSLVPRPFGLSDRTILLTIGQVACLLLPVGALCLAAGPAPAHHTLRRASAAMSAGAVRTLAIGVLRPALPGLMRAALIVGALSTGLVAATRP